MFKKFNITPLERLLRIAKANGVKHAASWVPISPTLPKSGLRRN